MSWQSLIKPPGKDPKNINEWLGLITEQIRELKQTQNWYDVSRVVMTTSIVDNLESYREDAILSANQGRVLKELIDTLETKVDELVDGLNGDISDINAKLDENIPKILANIEAISQLTSNLEQLTQKVTENSQSIENINTTLEEHATDLSELESSLNILSDRVNTNNNTITEKVNKLETKVDENVEEINDKISDIYSDTNILVGGNEVLSGLSISISAQNVITTTTGKVVLNGNVIDVNKQLTINVTHELLTKDYILLLTLKLNSESNEPELSLVETAGSNEVILSKLSIIDGKLSSNSKMEVLQPMNTMIGIAADNEAETIRETIPSGFTTLGELDYDYMINNENVVKLKTESVAYVNGYKVVIPKDTIINIGKAPEKEPREDLLFLEVWKDEGFPKTGKVKWRIRHVEDVDFKTFNDGFGFRGVTIGGVSYNYDYDVIAQGGLAVVPCIKIPNSNSVEFGTHCFYSYADRKNSSNQYKRTALDDVGLFIAGLGPESKNTLKTLDGFSYAIPMFRLYRKPSCGKSIPFEYSKINPIVDYSKFSKMVQDEKVERVHFENIKGRSLVNLSDIKTQTYTNPAGELYRATCVVDDTRVLENKKYTLWFTLLEGRCDIKTRKSDITLIQQVSGYGKKKYVLSIPAGASGLNFIVLSTAQFSVKDVIVLEGDWTDKEPPKYFTGLKSLGEDDGNLITLKNGILNDNTYDPCDGNQKLKLQNGITHVMSENTIIPEVEAKVKANSDDEGTDLEGLNTKLESTTEEGLVEFTKIKGRTIQNLIKNTTWTIREDGSAAFMEVDWSLLKPDTKYTYVVLNLNSKIETSNGYVGPKFVTASPIDISKPALLTTNSDLSNNTVTQPHIYRSGTNILTADTVSKIKLLLLEGDYSSTPLEEFIYVDEIKSIGENEENKIILNTTGKNLITITPSTVTTFGVSNVIFDSVNNGLSYSVGGSWNVGCSMFTKNLLRNTEYIIIREGVNRPTLYGIVYYLNNKEVCSKSVNDGANNFKFTTIKEPFDTVWFYFKNSTLNTTESFVKMRIYEVVSSLSEIFEPHKEYKQEIYLKEPLRSLPNGVCDEIVGNKVIRRVGKVVLDGSETIGIDSALNQTNTLAFWIANPTLPNKDDGGIITSNLPHSTGNDYWNKDRRCMMSANSNNFKGRLLRSELSSINVAGVKTWLSQNPTTVYYELANPITEYLEHVYDKESIKTYQLDAPLRSLPNGVKDEIKDGVLIRRCGEIILDGSDDEVWEYPTSQGTNVLTSIFRIKISNAKASSSKAISILCDKFTSSTNELWQEDKQCIWLDITYYINIRILNTSITEKTVTSFKTWLKSNPIKVVYEKDIATETILTESKPQDADFTLNRQFKDGNWLRELPNGVKDTVENGKVIRRVGKVVITNTAVLGRYDSGSMDSTNTMLFGGTLDVLNNRKASKDTGSYMTNLFKSFNGINVIDEEYIYMHENPDYKNHFYIRINKTKLSTLDDSGMLKWLLQNPVTVLYELATPTEEALSTDNYMLYSYHDFNTSCGSIYVGQGRNHVENENKMATEDVVVIDTPFRSIEGKDVVEDCRYKKRSDGYDTFYEPNLLTLKNLSIDSTYNSGTYSINDDTITLSLNGYALLVKKEIKVIPGVSYKLTFESDGGYSYGTMQHVFLDINGNNIVGQVHPNQGSYIMTAPSNANTVHVIFRAIQGGSKNIITYSNFNFSIHTQPKTSGYFENTEENDVDDLRHLVSLSGFNYSELLEKSFDSLLRGDL